jgi:hypothetical protein
MQFLEVEWGREREKEKGREWKDGGRRGRGEEKEEERRGREGKWKGREERERRGERLA